MTGSPDRGVDSSPRDELAALDGCTVLVTGADGMLGRAFAEVLGRSTPRCRVLACGRGDLDVTDAAAVMRQVSSCPDLILHCAANVNADACERDPDACRTVQVGGTANVVELAIASGARLMYPQSFLIFDRHDDPVTESASPSPLSAYGRYKLEAEELIRSRLPGALIVRMAGFFGGDARDKNFVGKFTRQLPALLGAGRREYPVGNRVWQPTYTADLAFNSLVLLAQRRDGVYHMGSRGQASFFDVATACVESLGLTSRLAITPMPSAVPVPEDARRPSRLILATERLDREGLNRQREWRAALDEYLARPYFDGVRAAASAGRPEAHGR